MDAKHDVSYRYGAVLRPRLVGYFRPGRTGNDESRGGREDPISRESAKGVGEVELEAKEVFVEDYP